jgi:hypothetical protein
MNDMQLFATFGLPAIAISASLLALWAAKRSADRIDAAEAARAAREPGRR